MRVEEFTSSACGWKSILDDASFDVYHLPEYCELSARQESGSVRAVHVTDGANSLLIPLVFRPVPEQLAPASAGAIDAVSPYGYPGPLVTNQSADFLRSAISSLTAHLRSKGAVSMFVRMHPLMHVPFAPLEEAGRLVQHGNTVAIDLTQSKEDILRQTRSSHRNEISKSVRRGLHASIDSAWKHFDQFQEMYVQTMRRVNATDAYYFDRDYFDGLRQALGDRIHLGIVENDGQILAGALFTECNGIVQYHLSGTHDDAVKLYPTKLLLDHVRWWAKERGNRWFHLGGGVGGREDSLFAFKRGFSQTTLPFYTWRVITNPDAYTVLTGRSTNHSSMPEVPDHEFFPAYRKPLADRSGATAAAE